MNNPKVSVVIPVYNAEKYIYQCLDSVLAQPMQDIEIICVNDGSIDNSPAILDQYSLKDNRIRVNKLLDVPILSIERFKQHRKEALVLISTSEPYHAEINKNLIFLGFKIFTR